MERKLPALVIGILLASVLLPTLAAALTSTEVNGLIYMREEEKLARDVYLALYQQWKKPVFYNIASAEQIHMDRVLALLNTYRIPDPAAGKKAGEFTNPVFVDLYKNLTTAGSASYVEALNVGVFIEETDIEDLTAYIAQTNRRDIRNVYTNIRNGSYNHLDAFTKLLGS